MEQGVFVEPVDGNRVAVRAKWAICGWRLMESGWSFAEEAYGLEAGRSASETFDAEIDPESGEMESV